MRSQQSVDDEEEWKSKKRTCLERQATKIFFIPNGHAAHPRVNILPRQHTTKPDVAAPEVRVEVVAEQCVFPLLSIRRFQFIDRSSNRDAGAGA
jgi:hypothetical protein